MIFKSQKYLFYIFVLLAISGWSIILYERNEPTEFQCMTKWTEYSDKIIITGQFKPEGNPYKEDNWCDKIEVYDLDSASPKLRDSSAGVINGSIAMTSGVEYEIAEITPQKIVTKPLVGLANVNRVFTIHREFKEVVKQEENRTGESKGLLTFKLSQDDLLQ
jgi:hypothetical protein